MLAALGVDAIALRDRFPVDVKDTEYLAQLRNTGFDLPPEFWSTMIR